MNEKFGLLVDSYFSCFSYCLFLSIEFLSNSRVMFTLYTPPIRSFYDMLIFAHIISYGIEDNSRNSHLRSRKIYAPL